MTPGCGILAFVGQKGRADTYSLSPPPPQTGVYTPEFVSVAELAEADPCKGSTRRCKSAQALQILLAGHLAAQDAWL